MRIWCLLFPLLLLLVSGLASAGEVMVFSAASLSDVFRDLAPRFQVASGKTLRFNFGGSGTLVRQIKEGAPADVFVSADEPRMDQLENAGLLLPGTRRILLWNTLVLVVETEASQLRGLDALENPTLRRLALGEPATVPAGAYAKAFLEKRGLWEKVAPKCVPLDNVRSVLAAVASGNANAGFVYRTDALASKKVRITWELPATEDPLIRYPGAVLAGSKQREAARAFLLWLLEAEAQSIFKKHGFLPAPKEFP